MTELRSYDPTWRERIGGWIAGDSPSKARRQFVEGLIGSSGLGAGIGLVDLIPGAGAVLGAQEAIHEGDYKGAALSLLPLGAAARVPEKGLLRLGEKYAHSAPQVADSAGEMSLRRLGDSLESKSASIYNPPEKPLRPFEADYPAGVSADESGRLTKDLEGRPLTARYIVGRKTVGGEDEAFPAAELDALAEALTGSPYSLASLRGKAGQFERRPVSNSEMESLKPHERDAHSGWVDSIDLKKGLKPAEEPMVLRHELGHAINDYSGTERYYKKSNRGRDIPFKDIPSSGVDGELQAVYRDQNGGKLPKDFSYPESEHRSEYWAEAIRAYKTDPNYFKTVAPNAAARIREFVNNNPRLNKIIQFNALVGAAGAGALANGGSEDDGAM